MKLFLKGITMPLMTMTILSACVNSISEEVIEPGETPIKISTNILCSNSRVTDSNFESDDAIGLYVLIQPKQIEQERYIDNAKLTCPDISSLEPEETIYYPTGNNVKCDFISYYPYQKAGISDKSNSIETFIKADQSQEGALSQSDFMVANSKDINPGNKAVSLTFQRKLCKVRIILDPLPGEDINTLLSNNPQVTFSGLHSKASYNFTTDKFSSFAEVGNITPHGTWEIKNGKIIGKEVHLFPEPLTTENHHIVIKVSGKSYNCTFPSDYSLESGTQNTLSLTYSSSEGLEVKKTDYSITQWEDGMSGSTDSEVTGISMSMSSLTFKQSNIYKIMSDGVQIAQICKEYLLADNINDQAIVAYPFKDGKADLSKGTLIGFPMLSNQPVGGSVSWSAEGKLTYTPGSLNSIGYLYFTKEHEITYSAPSDPLPFWMENDLLTDIRGDEKNTYPIVKIGTQYWMAANLNATKYTDGNKITKKSSTFSDPAGYYTSNNYIFYNAAAVNTGRLAPVSWKIPKETEWGVLKEYLNNNASLMKAGTWNKDSGNTLWPANNLSGFNGYSEGFFAIDKTVIIHCNISMLAGYWGIMDAGSASNKSNLLLNSHNEITLNGNAVEKALSVRCIRK